MRRWYEKQREREIACLYAGLRPQERRTVCLPIIVPFSFCKASSALFLKTLFKCYSHGDCINEEIKKHINERFETVQKLYLFANWTKPQPFPTGILTEAISPYWENVCLRSSSVTLESSPPTNIYNESLVSYLKLVINDKFLKCKT